MDDLPVKIIVFDPLDDDQVQKAEQDAKALYETAYRLSHATAGNRTGGLGGGGYVVQRGDTSLPIYKDYVVLIFVK